VELDLRLADNVKVRLEGWDGDIAWTTTPAGVHIELPVLPDERPAFSLRFAPATDVHPL
jgi:hypothetical protein